MELQKGLPSPERAAVSPCASEAAQPVPGRAPLSVQGGMAPSSSCTPSPLACRDRVVCTSASCHQLCFAHSINSCRGGTVPAAHVTLLLATGFISTPDAACSICT